VLIEYESESVRKIFNDYELMKKEIGNDRARAMTPSRSMTDVSPLG
jgi:hypothetical protein